MSDWTHEQLRVKAMRWLKNDLHCGVVLSETVSVVGEIPDAIGWKYGRSYCVECKVSRADFMRDKDKLSRTSGNAMGENFYYLAPPEIIRLGDLESGVGLLEAIPKGIKVQCHAQYRALSAEGHRNEKFMLLSAVRRIKCREFLLIGADEIDQHLAAD